MNHKFTKLDYVIFLVSIVGIVIYLLLSPQIHPEAAIRLPLSKQQITDIAFQTVRELGYDLIGFKMSTDFMQSPAQIRYLGQRFSSEKANTIMHEQIPVYYWKIEWRKPKDFLEKFRSDSEHGNVTIRMDSEENVLPLSLISLTLTTQGKLLSFDTKFEKDTKRDTISTEDAFQIASQLLTRHESDRYEFKKHAGDSTQVFTWYKSEPIHGEQVTIEIQLHHDDVVKYTKNFVLPEDYSREDDQANFVDIPRILVFMIYFIFIIVILVQKLRRDEISLKSGISLSIIVGLAVAYTIIISTYQDTFWDMLLPALTGPFFIIIFLLAVIGVSDSLGREVWKEKLITFDAFNRLKIRSQLFGMSIVRGITLAFLTLGSMTLILTCGSFLQPVFFTYKNSTISTSILVVPLLFSLAASLNKSSFGEFIFRLFTISFLRKKLSRNWAIIGISALLWTFNFIGEDGYLINPIYVHILINFIVGVLFAFFMIKYDFMTVFIGSILYRLIGDCYPMMFWGDTALLWNGIFVWIIVGFLLMLAFSSRHKIIDEKELSEYVPPYVLRMQERERLKRELEIARKVQLSFLPRTVPQIPGIDIATICIPANEVGGDYFDFIELRPGKLGVVIGDVSGKGIPAAFHMTLTKGLLKAQTRETDSPRDVLIRINELFYENVSRGIFISMIYGIFDFERRTLTFARAGHNPVIIRSGEHKNIELLCPQGIALGLGRGVIFNKHIEEKEVAIHKNDIFIFYTDGVSEAMNSEKIEFGEERLQNIITANSHVPADELIQLIHSKINAFVGNTPQHDDMTMIVVKITSS